ncbi:hypothetical protein [Cytobacillus kochii]|uniref:hypothetical protein n=1 Tax=Cytobacillus kochii TaxID=859143 RepID=UPI00203DCA60|nr:hypothetical protein [Cytobacillus kochii]MCM3324811.1 hypothetical protein [Cytobacillus kochii]MCM3347204.1 hypothetical protein [Cytobacillus kochii]
MIKESEKLKIQGIYRKRINEKKQNENLKAPKLILTTIIITAFFFFDANIKWF